MSFIGFKYINVLKENLMYIYIYIYGARNSKHEIVEDASF